MELIRVTHEHAKVGNIRPDSFVIDVDMFLDNARKMLNTAQQYNLQLFFMLKQIGRNPYIAKKLIEIGYPGAVVVDFKEAQIMMDHQIPIAHAGHLVQIPNNMIDSIIRYGINNVTIYSVEKAKRLNESAKKANCYQNVLIRVVDEEDFLYNGQHAGIHLKDILSFVEDLKKLKHLNFNGLTIFPGFLFNHDNNNFGKTKNIDTLLKAKALLEENGITVNEVNIPSATCSKTIPSIAELGGTSGEPGHGFTGTTPGHAHLDLEEQPSIVYLSEISHSFNGNSYFYGGGHYFRGHFEDALIINEKDEKSVHKVIPPDAESIDYYVGLEGDQEIGATVISLFRFQIFVSRSDVVLIEGIQEGKPKIVGIYDSLGREL